MTQLYTKLRTGRSEKVYCDIDCVTKHRAENPGWRGNWVTFRCRNCECEFSLPQWQTKDQSGIYCSRLCWADYIQKHKTPVHQLRICGNMRRAITTCLKGGKLGRKWRDLVGYTAEELIAHLEGLFKDGMSWDNYGEWHIDHIIPISAFRILSARDEAFRHCWGLKNLQPLWAKENQSKGGIKNGDNILYGPR